MHPSSHNNLIVDLPITVSDVLKYISEHVGIIFPRNDKVHSHFSKVLIHILHVVRA